MAYLSECRCDAVLQLVHSGELAAAVARNLDIQETEAGTRVPAVALPALPSALPRSLEREISSRSGQLLCHCAANQHNLAHSQGHEEGESGRNLARKWSCGSWSWLITTGWQESASELLATVGTAHSGTNWCKRGAVSTGANWYHWTEDVLIKKAPKDVLIKKVPNPRGHRPRPPQ